MDVVFVILGFIAGFITSYILRRNKSLGILEIDRTDPNNPYYRLDLTYKEFEEIPKHSTVIFKVKPNSTFMRQINNPFNGT